MRWILLLIGVMIVSGCASFGMQREQGELPAFTCFPLQEGRGVVAVFVPNAPPEVIEEGRSFRINLRFANHLADAVTVELFLQDIIDAQGFPAQGEEKPLVVDGSEAENDRWSKPGCRLLSEGGATQLSLGPYAYTSVDFDDDVRFEGRLRYDAKTEAFLSLCAYNPVIDSSSDCPVEQTFSGAQLGWRNDKAPVMIESVTKQLIGSTEDVKLHLKMVVRNAGGGYLDGDGTVQFLIKNGGSMFRCRGLSAGADQGQQLRLILDEDGMTEIECEASLTLDRVQAFDVGMELQYSYVYPFSSPLITLQESRFDDR